MQEIESKIFIFIVYFVAVCHIQVDMSRHEEILSNTSVPAQFMNNSEKSVDCTWAMLTEPHHQVSLVYNFIIISYPHVLF